MIRFFKSPRCSTLLLMILATGVSAGCGAVLANDLAPFEIYTSDGAIKPNTLYLGTPTNWAYVVPDGGKGALDVGSIKVVPTKVSGAEGIKVLWSGGIGQIYSQSKRAKNRLDYIDAKSALVFDAVVHLPPQDQVTMRIDCRYPCMGVVDMTDFFKQAPIDKKVTVKIPLSCFEASGTSFTGVNTPWLIYTTKPFSLSLGNIHWQPGVAEDADAIKC
jgi:beta-glucosidase